MAKKRHLRSVTPNPAVRAPEFEIMPKGFVGDGWRYAGMTIREAQASYDARPRWWRWLHRRPD